MSFDPSSLYYNNNINDNLLKKETVDNLNEQIKNASFFYSTLSLMKSYWMLIFFIVVIIILIILYKRHNKESFEMEQPEEYKNIMQQESEFGRPTFNPYHPLDANVNYNHDLGMDPMFNGVYNNNVKPIDYKPMEFLGAFDNMEYDFPNTRNIINTHPSYHLPSILSDKSSAQYKKINEENMNDVVKITYRKNNLK